MQKTFFIDANIDSTKSIADGKALKIAGYANTTDKDRTGDVVLASAWAKGIENFRRNPILLYQHDHNKPVGRITNIIVDKKGIFVEASISDSAESLYGIKTLIKDGVLKSFSVGFNVKEIDYDRGSDVYFIKDVELLEISVVSVPANQNSLFSVKKSFETDSAYAEFKKQFLAEAAEIAEQVADVKEPEAEPVTEEKTVEVDETKAKTVIGEEKDKEAEEAISPEALADPMKQIPFINLLSEDTSKISTKTFVVIDSNRYKTVEVATADKPAFTFEKCDAMGNGSGELLEVSVLDMVVINSWDLTKNYDIRVVITKSDYLTPDEKTDLLSRVKANINMTEFDLIKLKNTDSITNNKTLQSILNDVLNLTTTKTTDWNDSHYLLANKLCTVVDTLKNLPQENDRDLMLNVYGYNIDHTLKENTKMTTENVGNITTIGNVAPAAQVETKATAATVSEPRVAALIEKAGEAVLKAEAAEYKAAELGQAPDYRVIEELAELKGQLKAYREQTSAFMTSKMNFQEATRAQQFTQVDMANAVMLSKALNKNVFDTHLGSRMKAVITDTNLNEGFSTNVYNEMQMELIIAPMFNRVAVNSKDFRIPVADEDITDFVAQFPSGSFAAGRNDNVTVPTTRQAQIGAIDLQPKKFMVTTHIAKDEQEDTIIPLLDFLRQSATRRLARGIDKAILRGDGTLSAFSASNALASAGAYPSVITGVVELAAAVAGLVTKTSTTTTKAAPAQLAAARIQLGRYGLSVGSNLAYITSVEGYNYLVTTPDFQTVDKFGSQATYLTGSVGAIYGIPIYVSEFMDNATATDSNLGVLVYKPGFVIGERRAMELESEYLPQQQVTAMYMSTRFDFKALTTVANAALSSRYSYASLVTTA